MGTYIKQPNYIKSIQNIDSQNFKNVNFQKYYDQVTESYRLDLLRDTYKQDKDLFFSLRDELLLRGFSIELAAKSNLFPKMLQTESNERLSINEQTQNFQHINFSLLNLDNFVDRFNVVNDAFFDGIPLENFRYLNQYLDIELLKEAFLLEGFLIVKTDEMNEKTIKDEKKKMIAENKMTIPEYFYESKYERFLDFCAKEDVRYIEEITSSLLMRFAGTPYVGKTKLQEVRERLKKYYEKLESVPTKIGKVFKVDPVSNGKLAIVDYFPGRKFSLFREYTQEKGINYLEELKLSDLHAYSNYPGVGPGRLENVNKQIEDIKEWINNYYYFTYDSNNFDLHNHDINDLFTVLKLDETLSQNVKVERIDGKDIREMSFDLEDKQKLLKLSAVLSDLMEPNAIIEKFLKQQNEIRFKTLQYRFNSKKSYTLKEVGERLPYQGKARTREAIRQTEKKTLKDFILHLEKNFFRESILLTAFSLNCYQNEVFKQSELSNFLKEEYEFVLKVLANDDSESIFYYQEDYQLFFLNKKDKDNFQQKMQEIATGLPDVFIMDEVKEIFENNYFRDDILSIPDFLKSNDYKKEGKIYSNKYLTSHDIIKFLYKRRLPKNFRIDEETYAKMMKVLKDEYHYVLDQTMGSIENALDKSDEFILVNSRTYQLFDASDYDMLLIDRVVEHINSELQEKDSIDIEIIFEKYKEELLANKIQTKLHLYSIIKHLYSAIYQFGSGVSLDIYKDKEDEKANADLLRNFISENGEICTREEIRAGLGWPDSRITLTAGMTPEIINWGDNTYRIISQWITQEHVDKTAAIIRKAFDEQGFITENQLYERAQFRQVLNELIHAEKIDSATKFRSTFRYYFDELEGNAILITPEEAAYENIYDVILAKYPEGVTRKNLFNYLHRDLKYKENTSSSLIERMLEKNLFFEINLGEFYPTNKLNLSEEVVESVVRYVEMRQNESEYIVLKSLRGYRSSMPKINVEWTPYIIKQILINNGYKSIEIFNNDYRVDQLIMVKEDSEFEKIDELIHYLLQNDYIGTWDEKAIANYLEKRNILYKKKNERTKLPRNLYEQSDLLDVNQHGFVELKAMN